MDPRAVERATPTSPLSPLAPTPKKAGPAKAEGQQTRGPQRPLTVEERLLRKVTADQLHQAYRETRDGPMAAQLRSARAYSEEQRGQRKNLVFTKLGKGKDMHRLNVRMQKSFKDMLGGIRDLRLAAQMKKTGPDYLVTSMNRMLVATEGYMQLMRPLVPMMKDTNAINGQMAGSMRSERQILGTAARQKSDQIEDLPEELSSRGMLLQSDESMGETRDNMDVGKFYFAWTRESLSDGISLIGDVVVTMRDALQKGRDYLPAEASEGFEKRLAKLEARHAKLEKKAGLNGKASQSSAADLTEREKLEKGRGLRMNAEEGAMRRMDDEKSRMQEGLWAALAGDSFSSSL